MDYVSSSAEVVKGISLFDDIVSEEGEAIITVRGKSRYVVIDMKAYNRHREYELEATLAETRKDLAEVRIVEESVEDHIKRIQNEV